MPAVIEDRATEVEIFIVPETKELIYDDAKLDEWKRLNAELGIEVENISKKDKSPIPFIPMNDTMIEVFNTLCPRKVNYSAYKLSPIPLEVLKAIKLSIDEQYFGKIEICYDEKSKDPVVIGTVSQYYMPSWYDMIKQDFSEEERAMKFASRESLINYFGERGTKHSAYIVESVVAKYLIAKWGDVKYSFNKLAQMARERYIATESSELNKTIKEARMKLETIQEDASIKFGVTG